MKGTPGYVEVDSGIERADGRSTLRVEVREADGLRRHLVTLMLDDERALNLVRGGAFVALGSRAAEMDGADALVDALDVLTSDDGKRSTRSPREITDDLLADLGIDPEQAITDSRRSGALRKLLRSDRPRKVAE